ncbi:class F sortase [Streptomyces sp. S.PNR 29]|uniref:class F sortase n=1 Tax=Streptomyces sp. S.PNR 29 TaxID=2973805 RepID=UPI0025B1B4C5|nr:class F sortase [Streptomyces sp. S.PNR 29]MDN0196433.1 class F sortase [Streptomyces sp. S.PNR 29]
MAASPPSPTDTDPVPPGRRSRTGAMMLWSGAALALAVSLIGGQGESPDNGRAPHAASAVTSAPSGGNRAEEEKQAGEPSRAGGREPAGRPLPRSRPTRLVIPKISVNAPFTALAIGRSGQLEPPPPDETNLVGWYADGASPGEAGTAIIAGHVDTRTSPAVFAELGELKKGDRFQVRRADGRTASFVVDSVESFDKDRFPNERVYADTSEAEVRLITCSGDYDRVARDYTENLVVFAHLV